MAAGATHLRRPLFDDRAQWRVQPENALRAEIQGG